MGSKALIYKQKVNGNLQEAYKHLTRLSNALNELNQKYSFPLDAESFKELLDDIQYLAFSDQVIYRFSKLQDCMGAKLFKSLLLYQGENINKPFLDILNQIERMNIIDVDAWFEIRDLRNEIAHDYEDNDCVAINILNTIDQLKGELLKILDDIQSMVR
ncbi:MAG: hypothetical protein Q9M31_00505 [Mariprofundus sp.]|nr:hypothetical protein [Mariprofundus sp.]